MRKRNQLSAAVWMASLAFCLTPSSAQSAEKPRTPHEALRVETEDPVLKEQIAKVTEVLDQLHYQMAKKRQAIQAAPDPARKSALTAELDALRKERDILEKLLHDLLNETKATEQTKVDEVLQNMKRFEQRQELEYRQEEAVRDRRDQSKQE